MSATSLTPQLRNGNGESLSRAKAALKGRLKQQMMQEVLDELQDTEPIVQEAMDAFASKEEALKEAKEAIKASLFQHIRQQAVEEVAAEIREGVPEAYAEEDTLAQAKASFKQGLLEHILQQAIQEVGAEVQEAPDTLEAHGEALEEATAAFKARLREEMVQQAIASIKEAPDAFESHGDALEDARTAFKARLRDEMVQQAIASVEATPDVFETHGDAFEEATAAFKARLREEMVRQAIASIEAEAQGGVEHLLPQADDDVLAGIKATFKHQLLEGIYQQAIDEIDAEVDTEMADLTTLSMVPEQAAEEDEAISGFMLDIHDAEQEGGADPVVLFEDVDGPESFEDDSMLDVQFWDDPEDDLTHGDVVPPVELALPEDEIEEEPGFFLSGQSEDGSGSEAVALIDREDASLIDGLLDFDGDTTWEATVPYDDTDMDFAPVLEAEAPVPVEDEHLADEGDGPVYYLYGIYASESASAASFTIPGIDPIYPIYPLEHEGAIAIVSNVPQEEYGSNTLAVNLLDPVWKEQRAKVHDAIIEQIAGNGVFLPVPFGTTFASEEAVRTAIPEYLNALDRLQGRSQWRVRLYRNVDVLHQKVVESSPAVQQLMADIKSKTRKGGQSIKKQMVETIHEEEAAMTDACTNGVHERLFARADDVELGALDGENERDMLELILDAIYLVHRDEEAFFQSDVESLVSEYAPFGFEFNVSGPESPTQFSRVGPASSP